jgi:hypothetical protein
MAGLFCYNRLAKLYAMRFHDSLIGCLSDFSRGQKSIKSLNLSLHCDEMIEKFGQDECFK